MENLADWTNTRAKRKINNTIRRKQNKITDSDVTLDGMNAFVGCLLSMGNVRMPNYTMYWRQKTKLFSITGVNGISSEQRFKDLDSC